MISTAGRDRVAIATKTGIVSAVLAIVVLIIGLLACFAVVDWLALAAHVRRPAMEPGQPVGELVGIGAYALAAWYAWGRLRHAGRAPVLRWFTRADLRVLLVGVAALVAIELVDNAVLAALHQSDHVQAGFEGFSVATDTRWATAIAIALTVAGGVLIAPLAEEMIFRGLLFGGLARWCGVAPAALLSALAFAAIHGDPVFAADIAAGGVVTALAYAATGNLSVAVALHALNNAWGMYFLIADSLTPR